MSCCAHSPFPGYCSRACVRALSTRAMQERGFICGRRHETDTRTLTAVTRERSKARGVVQQKNHNLYPIASTITSNFSNSRRLARIRRAGGGKCRHEDLLGERKLWRPPSVMHFFFGAPFVVRSYLCSYRFSSASPQTKPPTRSFHIFRRGHGRRKSETRRVH